MSSPNKSALTPSLSEFMRAKKREGCKVCQLPVEIRDELKKGAEQRIPRGVQVQWLHKVGHVLTVQDLVTHTNARHDQ